MGCENNNNKKVQCTTSTLEYQEGKERKKKTRHYLVWAEQKQKKK